MYLGPSVFLVCRRQAYVLQARKANTRLILKMLITSFSSYIELFFGVWGSDKNKQSGIALTAIFLADTADNQKILTKKKPKHGMLLWSLIWDMIPHLVPVERIPIVKNGLQDKYKCAILGALNTDLPPPSNECRIAGVSTLGKLGDSSHP